VSLDHSVQCNTRSGRDFKYAQTIEDCGFDVPGFNRTDVAAAGDGGSTAGGGGGEGGSGGSGGGGGGACTRQEGMAEAAKLGLPQGFYAPDNGEPGA
jgi:hypothetical protein